MEESLRQRVSAATVRDALVVFLGRGVAVGIAKTVRRSIVQFGFWVAVLLPLAYVPLLATGALTQTDGLLLYSLLVSHAVALLVGHGHSK